MSVDFRGEILSYDEGYTILIIEITEKEAKARKMYH